MVSRNNRCVKLAKQGKQVQRWSIRKLGVGAASVMIGTAFFAVGQSSSVEASAAPDSAHAAVAGKGTGKEVGDTKPATPAESPSVSDDQGGRSKDAKPATAAPAQLQGQPDSKAKENSVKKGVSKPGAEEHSANKDSADKDKHATLNIKSAGAGSGVGLRDEKIKETKIEDKKHSSGDAVISTDIHQKLEIKDEVDANVEVELNNKNVDEHTAQVVNEEDVNGVPSKTCYNLNIDPRTNNTIKVTYSNLNNSFYNDQPIKSAKYTYSNFQALNKNQGIAFKIHNNINAGVEFANILSVDVAVELFDANNKQIKFEDKSKKGYLVLSSLNNYYLGGQHIERARVLHDGRALTIAGSQIAYHTDSGYLYADEDIENAPWIDTETGELHKGTHTGKDNRQHPDCDWDTNAAGTYIGSALIEIDGPTPKFQLGLDPNAEGIKSKDFYSWVWARAITVIPKNTIPSQNEKRNVQEIIHYVDETGKIVHDDFESEVKTVSRLDYLDGDQMKPLDWGKSTIDFAAQKNPKISGYYTEHKEVPEVNISMDKVSLNKETRVYTIEKTVVYHHFQAAMVEYVDDNTKQVICQSPILKGKKYDHIDYSSGKTVSALKREGYVLVSDDTKSMKFDDHSDRDQIFYVHLKHGTRTENQDVQVPRTIHYVYQNGGEASPDYTDALKYHETKVVDLVDGHTISDDWTPDQDFEIITSPTVEGYTPDRAEVSNKDIAHDHAAIEVIVTYTRIPDPKQPATPDIPQKDEDPDVPTEQPQAPQEDNGNKEEPVAKAVIPADQNDPTEVGFKPMPKLTVDEKAKTKTTETKKNDDFFSPKSKGKLHGKSHGRYTFKTMEIKEKVGKSTVTAPVKNKRSNQLPETGEKKTSASILGLALASVSIVGLLALSELKKKH